MSSSYFSKSLGFQVEKVSLGQGKSLLSCLMRGSTGHGCALLEPLQKVSCLPHTVARTAGELSPTLKTPGIPYDVISQVTASLTKTLSSMRFCHYNGDFSTKLLREETATGVGWLDEGSISFIHSVVITKCHLSVDPQNCLKILIPVVRLSPLRSAGESITLGTTLGATART